MRRIEARIGELLGEPKQGERTDLSRTRDKSPIPKDRRVEFRKLALAVQVGALAYEVDGDDSPAERSATSGPTRTTRPRDVLNAW